MTNFASCLKICQESHARLRLVMHIESALMIGKRGKSSIATTMIAVGVNFTQEGGNETPPPHNRYRCAVPSEHGSVGAYHCGCYLNRSNHSLDFAVRPSAYPAAKPAISALSAVLPFLASSALTMASSGVGLSAWITAWVIFTCSIARPLVRSFPRCVLISWAIRSGRSRAFH